MKLYFAPGACSLAAHIALEEAQISAEFTRVDLSTHKTEQGDDYTKINPKGYVPALRLDNGTLLTEASVILQYIADQKPDKELLAKSGTLLRYQQMEWLSFIATEIHKQMGPLFRPDAPAETKAHQIKLLGTRFTYLVEQLKGRSYLMGAHFTVLDAYLFTVLNWTRFLKFDIGAWPALGHYIEQVQTRPAVQSVLKAEGLLK